MICGVVKNAIGQQGEVEPAVGSAAIDELKNGERVVPPGRSMSSEDDPLLRRVKMPLAGQFYPLGFRVDISTNSEHVLAAAGESWNCFPGKPSIPSSLQLQIGILGEQLMAMSSGPGFPRLRAIAFACCGL